MRPVKDLKWMSQGFEAALAAAVESAAQTATDFGPESEALEAAVAAYHGVRFAAVVVGAANAVELSLRAAGVGAGDEVIASAFASADVVRGVERTGAKVVFADVTPATYTLCPHAVTAAVTPRTKAIVPTHLFGHPAEMTTLCDLARSRGLIVVEDCTEAVGAVCDGQRVGTFGDAAVFAFDAEPGACGAGAVVMTGDERIAARLWRLRLGAHADHPFDYEAHHPPLVAAVPSRQAALLAVRFGRLEMHATIRRRLADVYGRLIGGVLIPPEQGWARHSFHKYTVRAIDRTALRATLTAIGVDTEIPAVHPATGLPITERLATEFMTLPLNVAMTDEQVRRIVKLVNGTLWQGVPVRKAA